ncbi:MAG: hypothetical protein HQ541_11820 [Mariniphaga sp.]|nr:hypothetical protein [Mariniphaga sp.]
MNDLEYQKYELIKGHILDPENSPLPVQQQPLLDRIISASKLFDKNPYHKNVVLIHHSKYPEISRSQAYVDIRLAKKLYNSVHEFDFDFWRSWQINDIVNSIERCRELKTTEAFNTLAKLHTILFKVIGKRPDVFSDPKRHEKHNFYFLIQTCKRIIKINIDDLGEIPAATNHEINRFLFAGNELTDEEADEIFNS